MEKITKSIILAVLATVIFTVPTFADNPSSGDTKGTDISYTAETTEWTWTVPASQTFTANALTLTGDVAISPAVSGGVITLASGTTIKITMASANDFALKCGTSSIKYTISEKSAVLEQNAEVLSFIAGTSDNTGVSDTLTFATTTDNIAAATVAGQHKDTLTFTLSIS